jgi:cardiolipin synthase
LPWQKRQLWSDYTPRRIFLGLWKLNRRNHRKSCVIDGKTGFLGGMNITARQLVWRDTSVKLEGEGLSRLSAAFEHAWNQRRSPLLGARPGAVSSGAVRLNVTRKQRKAAFKDLVRRVLHAKRRIWITNPYFIPDLSLIRALRFAAWAGIDVRLLFPSRSDVWGIQWAIRSFYFILLSAKVRIFEYTPSVLHAKIAMIDDWVLVGSSNLNHRSLLHDLEVDAVLSSRESLLSLEEQFRSDLSTSLEVDARSWSRRGWVQKVMEKLALVFKRWL